MASDPSPWVKTFPTLIDKDKDWGGHEKRASNSFRPRDAFLLGESCKERRVALLSCCPLFSGSPRPLSFSPTEDYDLFESCPFPWKSADVVLLFVPAFFPSMLRCKSQVFVHPPQPR